METKLDSKKLINLGIISDINKYEVFEGKKLRNYINLIKKIVKMTCNT